MNRSKRYALAIAALALSVGFHAARADDEALFGALRSKVAELRAHESGEVLARMKNAFPHITACPPDTPEPTWGSRASIGLNGVDYLYGNPPTSADETEYCFFLVKPLHRALTVEEARDFSDAMMMPDILHSVGGKPSASERNERSVLAERHFLEIRALVKSGTAKPFDQNTTKRVIHPVGNLRNLEDCSQTPIDELEMRSWEGNPGSNDNQGLYNDQYYWRDLDPDGHRCIYMVEPFHRGLTIEEARDFLNALQLDLGYSEEARQELFGDIESVDTAEQTRSTINVDAKSGEAKKKRPQEQ